MESDSCILWGGRNRPNRELLSEFLSKAGYMVEMASSYEEIILSIEIIPIRLVLLGITGFDERVWPVCQIFKSHNIPFFVITAPSRAYIPSLYKAIDCFSVPLIKPLSIRPLLALIANSLSNSHE